VKPRVSQLAQSGATTGQVLTWNGTEWSPAAVTFTEPLLSDDDYSPLVADDGSGWLYPDP
jgi:hypothetical protein